MKNQILKRTVCMLLVFNFATYAQNKVVFNYTGSDQFYTVPAGITQITVKAWGGGGAGGNYSFNDYGGGGGYVNGVLNVTPGDVLKIIVGGGGKTGMGPGAYGGGGAKSGGNAAFGARGGGRSAVRNAADTELITAGGGGGGGGSSQSNYAGAGGGGGYVGGYGNFGAYDGQPGTQTAGGAAGKNINTLCTCGGHPGSQFQGGAATTSDNGYNGSGGGGYYGGGSGTDYGDGAGGGGSSYTPEGGCTIGATDFNAANNTDEDYKNLAGLGGQQGVNGKNGRVVLLLYGFCLSGTPMPITAHGACDGSIVFNPHCATAPYTFLWSDGFTSNPRNNICPGVYQITVTDAIGCSKTVRRKWADPQASFLSLAFTDASSKYCADGMLTATNTNFVSGTPATFNLYDKTNTLIHTWDLNMDSNASHTFSNLVPGLYTVTATSGNVTESKSGNVEGPCTFSFNDVTIDSLVGGQYGNGCEDSYEIKINYNGLACQPIVVSGYYFDYDGTRFDVQFNPVGNHYILPAFALLFEKGMTIVGNNGSCIDSIHFLPNYPPCIAKISNEAVSYEPCGASYGATGYGNGCNPLESWTIVGTTNNYFQNATSSFAFYANGIPDGTYEITFSNGYCIAKSSIVISGATTEAPTNLTLKQIGTSNAVRLKWAHTCFGFVSDINGYEIQVKKSADTNWTNYITTGYLLSKKIPNLLIDSTYCFRVRSKSYSGAYSLWSDTATFCIGINCNTARISLDINYDKVMFVKPNPATDMINIAVDGDFDSAVDIKIYNQLGQVVISRNQVMHTDNFQLDVSSLSNGLYIISLVNHSEKHTTRFTINR